MPTYSRPSDYLTPYMPEAVRQQLRKLYRERIDTYPYYYYPVSMRSKGDRDPPRVSLPRDLQDPNPRE